MCNTYGVAHYVLNVTLTISSPASWQKYWTLLPNLNQELGHPRASLESELCTWCGLCESLERI